MVGKNVFFKKLLASTMTTIRGCDLEILCSSISNYNSFFLGLMYEFCVRNTFSPELHSGSYSYEISQITIIDAFPHSLLLSLTNLVKKNLLKSKTTSNSANTHYNLNFIKSKSDFSFKIKMNCDRVTHDNHANY